MNLSTTRRLGVAAAIAAAVSLAFGLFAPAARAALQGDDRGRATSVAEFQEGVAGGTVSGCSGTAVSKNENNEPIDSVSGPGGPPASRSNALKIDYDGVVSYDGRSDAIIKNHNWHISIMGVKVKSDGDTNDEERQTDASDEKVSDYIPFRMSGKYFVSFEISGEGGSCEGSLWVEIDEDPVGTIPWFVGAGFLLIGVAGLAFAVPTGAAAGAAAGMGAGSTIGAAGTTPGEAVIGGDPAAPPPADSGQVIGDSGADGSDPAGSGPDGSGDDNGPVIGG